MPRKKAEAGSLTGSKRVKETASKRTSTKAKQALDAGGNLIKDTAKKAGANIASTITPENIIKTTGSTVNAVTGGIANIRQQVTDIAQLKQAITNQSGFEKGFSELGESSDIYGGLKIPEFDAQGSIPQDLTDPSNLASLGMSDDEAQKALAIYGKLNNRNKVLRAGYKYVEGVGLVKQGYEKARQSIIKGATEEIKTNQTIVTYDTERINLEGAVSKRDEANERLKQQQVKTLGAVNETNQLMQLITAKEAQRDANIQSVIAKTEEITSKYLLDSAT